MCFDEPTFGSDNLSSTLHSPLPPATSDGSPGSGVTMSLARPTALHAATPAPTPVEPASAFSKVTRRGQPGPTADARGSPPRPQRRAGDPPVAFAGPIQHSTWHRESSAACFSQNGVSNALAPMLPHAAFALEPPAVPAAVAVPSITQPAGYLDAEGGGVGGGGGGGGGGEYASSGAAQMEEELGRLYGMHLNSLMQIQAQLQRVRSQARSPNLAFAHLWTPSLSLKRVAATSAAGKGDAASRVDGTLQRWRR